MRYTILGFNQTLAIENDLSVNDLLLLQYIMEANGQPNMQHIVENEISYVWLSHTKIKEDLPILNISEGTLRNKLSELKTKNLITSISISNKSDRGSRTYYSITEKTVSLLNDTKECSCHGEMTSYNKLNNTNVYSDISKDISSEQPSEFQFGKSEPKKPNLYQNCISLINNYTEDCKIRQFLKNYLDLCMEMKCIRGANQWKGMLNTLDRVSNGSRRCDIIQNSIDHGWKTFYPLNQIDVRNKKDFSVKRDIEMIEENDYDKYDHTKSERSF